jgi:hypothetical protein
LEVPPSIGRPKKFRDDPDDRCATTCSRSTRVNRRTGYVNKPHARAAFFVHDRGEKVHMEQRIKISIDFAKIKRC